jgi:hypothetical protein
LGLPQGFSRDELYTLGQYSSQLTLGNITGEYDYTQRHEAEFEKKLLPWQWLDLKKLVCP